MGSDWLKYKLAALCDSIDYGFTTSAKNKPVGPKFLRITDIVSGHIDWDAVPYCESNQATTGKYLLHDNDIVIARTGASTGSSMFIAAPPKAVFASYLVRLQVSKKAHSRFISYFLKSPTFWAYMRGVLGDKSAQPNASAKTITQVKLRLPPSPDQRAIAHILGSLDDKIELNRRMNKTLEAMARAIFKSWFIDFDPVLDNALRACNPIPESMRERAEMRKIALPAPQSEAARQAGALFPNSFQDSDLGEIPKGWEVGAIADLANVTSGKRPQKRSKEKTGEFTIPLYGGGGIMAYVSTPMISEPFLLTGRVGTLGKIFCITEECWPSDNTLLLFPLSNSYLEYLYFILHRIDFDSLNRGSTQPLVTQTDLKNQRVVIPNENILRFYWQQVHPMFERIENNTNEIVILASFRDTLLPKLISGELRVPDVEKFVEEAGL